ncbi:MAG: hypothetical protein KF842_13690 [Caulobacter sp.]|nr:hypothetical protein [Caulobacter sp.]
MSIIALAAAAALVFQPAAPPSTPDEDTTVDAVVVSPPVKLDEKEAIAAFVEDIASESGNGRIARWDRKVCPGVAGVKAEYAQFIADRIGLTAQQVGLDVGEPGCKVNVLVVFTADSDGFVKNALKNHPYAFSRYDLEMTAGRSALRRFTNSKAPVRWWHVTHRVTEDGTEYNSGDQVQVYSSGRISTRTRDDFDRAIVVVDASRVGQVRFPALADYIAFVSLAQIEPDAAPKSAPSILSLFADREAGREPQQHMTDWDIAYITGVYSARRDTFNAEAQKRDITNSMGKDLQKSAPARTGDGEDPEE